VLKLLPPLTISGEELERGLEIIARAVAEELDGARSERVARPSPARANGRVNGHGVREVLS
jgi:hypothetical protein